MMFHELVGNEKGRVARALALCRSEQLHNRSQLAAVFPNDSFVDVTSLE
jgi:hypothetical protein